MTPARKLFAGLLFTGCAGFIDAVGFIELGGYFTSFMSGNTTQLGVGLVHSTFTAPALPIVLILMFFAGGLFGSLISLSFRRWGSVLLLTVIVLATVWAVAAWSAGLPVPAAIFPLAAAAGSQNAILPQPGAARLGTTYVTGTLFSGAQDLARALLKQAPRWRWLQHVAVWASLACGAALGAMGDFRWGIPVLLGPAVVYACLLAVFTMAACRARNG